MDFTHVLLICIGGIAACAALVFAVETLVAFCFHEVDTPAEQVTITRTHGPVLVDDSMRDLDGNVERAA